MRYAIFSDIHSNLEALNAVLDAYKKERVDKYLCIGDLVGYGADPKECIKRAKEVADVICAGNHDWGSVNLFPLDFFNSNARTAVLWTRKNLEGPGKVYLESLKLVFADQDLTLVHGTLDDPQEFNYMTDAYIAEETFKLMRTNVCFLGHTHTAGVFEKVKDENIYYREAVNFYINDYGKYIVNVGSVGQPRDRNPRPSYCIFDTGQRVVELKRVDYDIETARKKILGAGLPEFLADRLLTGR
ncbi:MAG: metallophosphoesterase family protein [Candidatus Omnitrophica bacterium]|nr:metallophosphoesterase family protein [Candidatus Omnitrophota bacterium]